MWTACEAFPLVVSPQLTASWQTWRSYNRQSKVTLSGEFHPHQWSSCSSQPLMSANCQIKQIELTSCFMPWFVHCRVYDRHYHYLSCWNDRLLYFITTPKSQLVLKYSCITLLYSWKKLYLLLWSQPTPPDTRVIPITPKPYKNKTLQWYVYVRRRTNSQ